MLQHQDKDRKLKIFKDALQFQESAAGVAIQKVPSTYLHRILKPVLEARAAAPTVQAANRIKAMDHCPDRNDPLVHAIYSMETIFRDALNKGVDILSSAEGIAGEHIEDGAKGNGCLFLAWKTTFDSQSKRVGAPTLVGAMTMYKFKRTSTFSTHRGAMSAADNAALDPFFGAQYLYIDAMASIGAGVGTLLVLHAYRYAIMKKAKGLVALSYSNRPLTNNSRPESYKIFERLQFVKLVPNATFTIAMYGTWFATKLDDTTLMSGVLESGIKLCTRRGFTQRTEDTLVWRCPR